MARTASNKKKRRLNLETSEAVRARLEKLKVSIDADSLSEVVRRTSAVYEHLFTAVAERDAKVVIRLPDGTEEGLLL